MGAVQAAAGYTGRGQTVNCVRSQCKYLSLAKRHTVHDVNAKRVGQ